MYGLKSYMNSKDFNKILYGFLVNALVDVRYYGLQMNLNL